MDLFALLDGMSSTNHYDLPEGLSVPFLGSKYRIWKQLCSQFPIYGQKYLELFAGRGNIFFNFQPIAVYNHYQLNDKYTGKFFQALKEVDLALLPDRYFLDNGSFELWRQKASINDPMALVLEPFVTFQGVGYQFGVGTIYKKQYDRVIQLLRIIKKQIQNVQVTTTDYVYVDVANLTFNDFVYCDPPYLGCKDRVFPNIDHNEFLQFIKSTKARWAISGYDSELYLQELGEPTIRLPKILTSSGCNNTAIECLWTNY